MTHIDYGNSHPPLECPSSHSKLGRICSYLNPVGTCFLRPPKPLYSPLPHNDSIRLLKIHPGNPGEEIKCSLQLVRLNKTLPSYEALSYVWSLKEGSRSITCNGYKKDDVATNLFEALERLRSPQRPRLIWVDALCIYQEDDQEKGQQVRKMHHIYRRASRVIVWLGTDDHDEAHPAFAILCAMVNAQSSSDTKPATYNTIDGMHKMPCMHSLPPLESKIWDNATALFTNTWFLRMWVIQEIVLAQSATFIWGAAELDWEVMRKAINIIRSRPSLKGMLESRNLQNAFFMHHLCEFHPPLNGLSTAHPFIHLLDLARSFDVTEPRDKVYGLLGFPTRDASMESGIFMQPSYKLSVAEVYTEVARKLLEKAKNLDVLSFAVHSEEKDIDDRMPSWVPDWNSKTVVYPLTGFGPSNKHSAGTSRPLEMSPNGSPTILRMKGVSVDIVSASLSPTPFKPLCESAPNLRHLLEWCIKQNQTASVIAKTLTAGRDIDGDLIVDLEQHLADFCAFMEELDTNWLRAAWPDEAEALLALAARKRDPNRASEAVWRSTCYRSPFVTKNGKLGLGPGATRAGDLIVVLWGGQLPFVLRRTEGGWYQFVGECYVEGIVNGEVEKGGNGYVESDFELR